jgi:hypothetical protein
VNQHLWSSQPELEAAMQDPNLPGIERLLVSILLAGQVNGDPSRAEFFLQRLLGKVKDQVEVSTPKPFVVKRRNGEQIEAGVEPAKEEES